MTPVGFNMDHVTMCEWYFIVCCSLTHLIICCSLTHLIVCCSLTHLGWPLRKAGTWSRESILHQLRWPYPCLQTLWPCHHRKDSQVRAKLLPRHKSRSQTPPSLLLPNLCNLVPRPPFNILQAVWEWDYSLCSKLCDKLEFGLEMRLTPPSF